MTTLSMLFAWASMRWMMITNCWSLIANILLYVLLLL
jgi:hypothetical protein